jgi:sterol desaturase/sphingolipid hydroxylase (fatty acid hydroxylase superfamily)
MDLLNVSVFLVALCFGLAQYFFERHETPVTSGVSRWWTNGLLYFTDIAVVTIFAAAIAWLVQADNTKSLALLPVRDFSVPMQMAALLLVHGFVQYWVHRAGHQIPLLWSWHRIHHTDKELDATTGLRHHPFESILDYIAFLLPTLLLSPSPAAILSYFILTIAFAMFAHFPTHWLSAPIDQALSLIIVTPRLHQLHHSTWHKETDTNYGNVLVIWDRMFGTYHAVPDKLRADFALGLDEFPRIKAEDPFHLLISPFSGPEKQI